MKQLQHQLNETQGKLEEVNRTLNDFDAAKKKLSIENSDLLRQLEEAESQVSQLSKIKISLTTQLEDTKRLADEESRERATLLGKFRNLEHDLDNIREQVEEEAEGKADLQRQLSKANAEAQLWRTKYESEGVARAEELEEAKRKLQARLAEAEETIESLNQKVIALEKTKQRLSTEVEDLQIEVDRATAIANAAEKKQKAFDKIIGEWKLKVDDLAAELDASQKECRNYSTELFRLRGTCLLFSICRVLVVNRYREITRAKCCCRSPSSIFKINKYTYSESLIQYKTRNKYSLLFVALILDMNCSILCRTRSRLFIYTSRGRVGKFKFVFVRRWPVAAALFCPEFICSYIAYTPS